MYVYYELDKVTESDVDIEIVLNLRYSEIARIGKDKILLDLFEAVKEAELYSKEELEI